MIKMARALMEKVNNMPECMDYVSIKMETLRKNLKEKLEIKNSVTEINIKRLLNTLEASV